MKRTGWRILIGIMLKLGVNGVIQFYSPSNAALDSAARDTVGEGFLLLLLLISLEQQATLE
jgi:hypothetical protein